MARPHLLLAEAHSRDGHAAASAASYERALRRDPGHLAGYARLGEEYAKLGELDRAAEAYTMGLTRDAEDADLKTAAMRETWEEVGLDLAPAIYLGPLDQQRAMPRGRPLNMLIAPHVFKLERAVEFNINYEVAEVVWTEMGAMVTGANHDWETKLMAGRPTVFNGYRLAAGHFVWGLTYRMVKSFFAMLDPAWQPPPER